MKFKEIINERTEGNSQPKGYTILEKNHFLKLLIILEN